MIEEWRAIKKVPGYEVSNMGNVRDAKTKKEVHQVISNGKMAAVFKLKNHKVRKLRVPLLVAQAFIPNPYDLSFARNKDGDIYNNCVDNIEWCRQNRAVRSPRAGTVYVVTESNGEQTMYPFLADICKIYQIQSHPTLEKLQNILKEQGIKVQRLSADETFVTRDKSRTEMIHKEIDRFLDHVIHKYGKDWYTIPVDVLAKNDNFVAAHYKFIKTVF